MAHGFDASKATNDLRQLLNLNSQTNFMDLTQSDIVHDPAGTPLTSSKKKTRKKGKNSPEKKDKSVVECEAPSSLNAAGKATTNSNGNALLTASNTVQNITSRTESSVAVMNSKDSDSNLSTKSKSKKDKEKKHLNLRDNANMHQQGGELTPPVQDKITSVATHAKSDSSQGYSTAGQRGSEESCKKATNDSQGSSHKSDTNLSQKEKEKNMPSTSKAKQTKLGEEELTPEFLSNLEPHRIHILKKKNHRFPKANFFCRLCDYHLDRKEDCEKHVKENRHCRRKEVHEVDALLQLLPAPTLKQLDALTRCLDKVDQEHGISEEEMDKRLKIVQRLESTLNEKIPDVILYMYGTSLTRMGLKSGDINVDLNSSDKNKKLTFLLKEIYDVMKDRTDTGFSNVHSDFSATVPALLLTDVETGFQVTVTIHCYSAHCSSELMSIYSAFDDRVRKLCVAFRYWAHVCGLDRQADGFIPPVALNIMVIFFLQSVVPAVVPVIVPPKVSGEETGDYRQDAPSFQKLKAKVMNSKADGKNIMNIGELWLRLLKYYSLEFDTANVVVCIRTSSHLSRNTKPWNFKKLAVEDPYMLKKNITRVVNNSRIYEYWQDCIRNAYYYFGLPRDQKGRSLIQDEELKRFTKSQQETLSSKETEMEATDKVSSKTENQRPDSVSSINSQSSQNRVVVPTHPLLMKSSQNSNSSDTQSVTLNSAGNISDASSPEEKSHSDICFEKNQMGDNSLEKSPREDFHGEKNIDMHHPVCDGAATVEKLGSTTKNLEIDDAASVNDLTSTFPLGTETLNISVVSPVNNISPDQIESSVVSDSKAAVCEFQGEDNAVISKQGNEKDSLFSNEKENSEKQPIALPLCLPMIAQVDCFYDFLKDTLTDGKGPTLMCTTCEKEGHLKNSCPEDELPPILPLPAMTKFHHDVLEETINQVPTEVGLSQESFEDRKNFIARLEKFIKYQYTDAELQLFGSSCNGFGFRRSDMDICMTLSRRGPNIDKVHVIEKLAHMLRQYDELQSVQAISTAKVPIVKFTVRGFGLEGDISLYNTLAQENTKLLKCYSDIDPRVKTLGYAIKTFAKVCDIGDASRGSLSSYAYILMMLYYLQQVKPAVIPVLQELYSGDKKPVYMVEGCDAWFMDNLDRLRKIWSGFRRNKMSVAELWLGFLRFYIEEFNYKEFVVCIRQKELLTRFDKLWNGSSIAIEDPFDLNHNLGSGLTRTMNNFIFKTFINGRMVHGSPIDENMEMFNKYQEPSDYFFDSELLSESRPPNVRGCRRCGKIGHMVRHCPLNKKDKEEEQKKPQPQKSQQMQPSNARQADQQSQGQLTHKQNQQPRNQPPSKSAHQQHHNQYQHQHQQQYRQSSKHVGQQQRPPSQHHQHMHMEKDWRDRDYRQNSSNNNNTMRVPPSSDSSLPFNLHNNHPGLVPSMPRGISKPHNRQDQVQHPMPIPNRFPSPRGSGPAHPRNSSKLPPSLSASRPTMPGVYYAPPFTEPRPHFPNFRMGSPSGFYHESSGSAPPNYSGQPYNRQQAMNPVVQSLFASTQGQVLDVGAMMPKNQQKKQ